MRFGRRDLYPPSPPPPPLLAQLHHCSDYLHTHLTIHKRRSALWSAHDIGVIDIIFFCVLDRCFQDFLLGRSNIVKLSNQISLPDMIRLEVITWLLLNNTVATTWVITGKGTKTVPIQDRCMKLWGVAICMKVTGHLSAVVQVVMLYTFFFLTFKSVDEILSCEAIEPTNSAKLYRN